MTGCVQPAVAGPRPRVVTPPPGPRSKELRESEAVYLAPGYQAIAAHSGIVVERGEGCEIIDVDGNRFLDVAAGICVASLGYAHPEYVRLLSEQLQRTHAGSFTTEARVHAVRAVASVAPSTLTRVQFYSGGSEAVESAIRLAKAYTGKFEVLSFWGGFHGKTPGALAQMGSDFKHGLGPLAVGAYLTPYADCAFCPFQATYPQCGLLCVDFARAKLRRETSGRLAAILVEPIQGTAGNVVPPEDFLPAVVSIAREFEALLIVDEMICGFGRTGKMFGLEHTGVRADIVTLGKALGGGFPVSAVLTSDEVSQAEPWSRPSFSSSSYGGNPLAAAAVVASLGIIKRQELTRNALLVGNIFRSAIQSLCGRHSCVANVRGAGLMIGFDLVESNNRRELWPADRCMRLFHAALSRGLISMAYSPRVRINPPLVLSEEQALEAVGILDGALGDIGF